MEESRKGPVVFFGLRLYSLSFGIWKNTTSFLGISQSSYCVLIGASSSFRLLTWTCRSQQACKASFPYFFRLWYSVLWRPVASCAVWPPSERLSEVGKRWLHSWPNCKVLCRHLPGGLRKTTKTSVKITSLQAEISTRDPSRVWSRSANHSTTTFGACSCEYGIESWGSVKDGVFLGQPSCGKLTMKALREASCVWKLLLIVV
jgi:hypothetical protein